MLKLLQPATKKNERPAYFIHLIITSKITKKLNINVQLIYTIIDRTDNFHPSLSGFINLRQLLCRIEKSN